MTIDVGCAQDVSMIKLNVFLRNGRQSKNSLPITYGIKFQAIKGQANQRN